MCENTQDRRKKIDCYSYCERDRLSGGRQAGVYAGANELTGEETAVKVYSTKQGSKAVVRAAEQEVEAMRQLRHANVVKAVDIFATANNCYVITELCAGRDLRSLLHHRGKLEPAEAAAIFVQVVSAVEHLHRHNFIHNEIKPSNILFQDGVVKLGDFTTCCKSFKSGRKGVTHKEQKYLSPEAKLGEFCAKVDVWAVVLILYEMVVGSLPEGLDLEIDTNTGLGTGLEVSNRHDSMQLTLHKDLPREWHPIVRRGLVKDKALRLSIENIVKEKWVQAVFDPEPTVERMAGIPVNVEKAEKFLYCHLHWAKFLGVVLGLVSEASERQDNNQSGRQDKNQFVRQGNNQCGRRDNNQLGRLRLVVLKQMVVQVHNLRESLEDGLNPFSIPQLARFRSHSEKSTAFRRELEPLLASYDEHLAALREMVGVAGECEANFANLDLAPSEYLPMVGISLSLKAIRELWAGREVGGAKKDQRPRHVGEQGAWEDSRLLDYLISYYQYNCLLVEFSHQFEHFERVSQLRTALEVTPVSSEMLNLQEIQGKLQQLELIPGGMLSMFVPLRTDAIATTSVTVSVEVWRH